ncbi:Ycf51 family protein [Paenibacillus alvei]|nr:Ycf51 family protein [Paenibacillus alvei]
MYIKPIFSPQITDKQSWRFQLYGASSFMIILRAAL